ncbi:amidohydrolase family protein [Propionibacterium sp.]|uniref:amidohydrolase n=1 Tax=Propionibacterium sp. TaxID=1977903 RepID=UPI0039EA98A3
MRFRHARMLDLVSGRCSEPRDVIVCGSRVQRSGMPADHDSADDEVIDLKGRFIMPGLWDAHVHTDLWAQNRARIDLSGADSIAQALKILDSRATAEPGDEPLVATGARLGSWLDAEDTHRLDALCPGRAVVVCSRDLHSVWVNDAVLCDPEFARRADGASAGSLLREQDAFAVERIYLDAPAGTMDQWVDAAARAAARRGVVGIVDFQDSPDRVSTWRRRISSFRPSVRVSVSCWPHTLQEAIEDKMTTGFPLDDHGWLLGGPLKVILDGSLSSGTAWCTRPYAHPVPGVDPFGEALVSPAELSHLMSRAEMNGLHTSVHAIGDAAIATALDCFAETGAQGGIEHACLATGTELDRMAVLGVRASVQPAHLLDDRELLESQCPDRTGDAFALHSCLAAGVRMSFGSDAPVAPLDPWLAISAAVLRARPGEPSWHPEQRLGIGEAMRASTGGIGKLVPGGQADLIVLDENPLTRDPQELAGTAVHLTMAAGQITWWADAE